MEAVIIGIAGGTGSGKTTITDRLKEKFRDKVSVVYHDNYYHRHIGMTYEERAKINYDSPQAFETELLAQHLQRLRQGQAIECPVYDYSIHNRTEQTIRIEPTRVILVEGILVLQDKRLRDMMDIKIFVDTDADERIMRRIKRDMTERKRSIESIMAQYRDTVKPMHEKYVEPSKKYADIIVVGGGRNEVALNMISTWVERQLDKVTV